RRGNGQPEEQAEHAERPHEEDKNRNAFRHAAAGETVDTTPDRRPHVARARIAAAKVSARRSRMMMLLTFQSPKAIATTATAAAVAFTAVRVTSRPGAVAGAGSTRRRSVFAWTAMRPILLRRRALAHQRVR